MLLVFHRKFGSSVELRFGASSLFRIPLPRQHSVRNSELHVMAPLARGPTGIVPIINLDNNKPPKRTRQQDILPPPQPDHPPAPSIGPWTDPLAQTTQEQPCHECGRFRPDMGRCWGYPGRTAARARTAAATLTAALEAPRTCLRVTCNDRECRVNSFRTPQVWWCTCCEMWEWWRYLALALQPTPKLEPLAVYFYCLPLRLQFSIWGLLIDLSECMRALPKECWRLHVQKWFANVTHRVVHNEYYRLLNACKHMRYHAVDRHQMNRLLRAMRYSSSQITAIDNVAYEFFTGHQPSERQWRQVLAPSFWPPRFSL